MARTRWMKALALLLALASLTINFGLIDLIDGYTGFVDQARNQVLDAGWGLVFGVILPVRLAGSTPAPGAADRRHPADGNRRARAGLCRCAR